MAIVKYIPKPKVIKDFRKPEGGYFEATCEECGTTYYPLRSTSKFCSKSCLMMNWRKKNPKTLVKSKKVTKSKAESKKELFNSLIYTGSAKGVMDYLKSKYNVTKVSLKDIKLLDIIDSTLNYDENFGIDKRFNIVRISSNKYEVYKL